VRLACALALPLTLVACSASTPKPRFADGRFARGDERFRVAPPATWEQVKTPGDLAFRAPEGDAVIAANATCRGHHDGPLPVLANDLVIGTTQRKVLLEETTWLDGREALHQVISLRLDGVPLIYDLYVLKKDGCVYDLTLVAPPRSYERTADTFVAFVAGFRGRGAGPGE
jgi:hypothetical protein